MPMDSNNTGLRCSLLEEEAPLWKTVAVASIGAGVMFGIAILSLAVPYVQHLGVPHSWASFIWLSGSISTMVVQPLVGYASDRSTSTSGKRKPFIVAGVSLICISVLTIGYALEAGVALGDSLHNRTKPRGVALFVVAFWILVVANNVVQDPTRAFLADLAKHNHRRIRIANALYSFFMAIGSILGAAATSNKNLYKVLPFTRTQVCDVFCANLKTCFLLHLMFILCISALALLVVSEPKHKNSAECPDDRQPFFAQLSCAIGSLQRPMWLLYLVTALNWIGWLPFLLFDTDWVGKEVYGGDVNGDARARELYDEGVREGSWGLMLYSVAVGGMSLFIDPLSKALGGARKLWGLVNFILAGVLAATVLVTIKAKHDRESIPAGAPPSSIVRAATLSLFTINGIPQAVTHSVPFALASMFSSDSGAGHGLSLGMMNLSVVIPQMLVSVTAGFWDSLFGGGNLPAFVLAAFSAALSGILALTVLPSPSSNT